jgi:hypothetical protein
MKLASKSDENESDDHVFPKHIKIVVVILYLHKKIKKIKK